MNRNYFNTGTPYLTSSVSSTTSPSRGVDGGAMDFPHPPAPFHYLMSEQAKSLLALQELQHEVGALLEFRELVMETFPSLRCKFPSGVAAGVKGSSIPVRTGPGEWTPGRVRKKGKKVEAVQDSGFSTEASSKEHSAGESHVEKAEGNGTTDPDDSEDELWNLLDIIHRKGTRLKDEVEALQDTIRDQHRPEDDFQRVLFHGSADDIHTLREERDLLLERLAEMEAEVEAGRLHTSRLQEDLEHLLTAKQDLQEQLKAAVEHRGEVNSRIHDLHSQFVAGGPAAEATTSERRAGSASPERCRSGLGSAVSSQRTKSDLNSVLGDRIPKVNVIDSRKVKAILKEKDPLVLQKHLLTSTVQNQVLQQQLDTAARLEVGLVDKLDKAREENEDLRFQLEDKSIQLEGTLARCRMLEILHQPALSSPDLIPCDGPGSPRASMKALSPLSLHQAEHTSSTESAHQDTADRKGRRKPSRIPLKSYTAPKPPTKTRSRSGDSPGRPHSSQSRHRGAADTPSLRSSVAASMGGGRGSVGGGGRSRHGSLVTAKDSLSGKLRSTESVGKGAGKWSPVQDKVGYDSSRLAYPSRWSLSSCSPMDSLDRRCDSTQPPTVETSSSQRFQTANTFLWSGREEFYDSIDTGSSLYQQGEQMAECDSLEKAAMGDAECLSGVQGVFPGQGEK